MFNFRRTISVFLTYIAFLISFSSICQAEDILIYIRDDVYADYQRFVKDRDIQAITNFSGSNVRRDVVDMIIAQQALKIGGFNHSFHYAPGKLNFRNTKMLQAGRLLISFDSYWLSDAKKIQDDVYISQPVIRQGEYIAGIYTSPKNKDVLSIKTLNDLSKFTAVSTPKWTTDWKTLKNLPLKKLEQEDEWLSQARMVSLGWIDFMLIPFHTSDEQAFTVEKIHLVPVKEVGIKLNDSRHFVISNKHPLGKSAYQAMNIGLTKLRKEGKVAHAYIQAGFFIDESHYNILNQ